MKGDENANLEQIKRSRRAFSAQKVLLNFFMKLEPHGLAMKICTLIAVLISS
jgi:hypothetical protein